MPYVPHSRHHVAYIAGITEHLLVTKVVIIIFSNLQVYIHYHPGCPDVESCISTCLYTELNMFIIRREV